MPILSTKGSKPLGESEPRGWPQVVTGPSPGDIVHSISKEGKWDQLQETPQDEGPGLTQEEVGKVTRTETGTRLAPQAQGSPALHVALGSIPNTA